MSDQILPGIPASIPRQKVVGLVESLGFDLRDLTELEFHREAIYATVFANHPEKERGWRYAVGDEAATHRVCIPITDDPDARP